MPAAGSPRSGPLWPTLHFSGVEPTAGRTPTASEASLDCAGACPVRQDVSLSDAGSPPR